MPVLRQVETRKEMTTTPTTDHQERARVRGRIGSLIMEFCRQQGSGMFFMEELNWYVRNRVRTAPDSPGRVLRELRREGRVRIKLISRSRSLYQVERPAEQAELFAARAS